LDVGRVIVLGVEVNDLERDDKRGRDVDRFVDAAKRAFADFFDALGGW
jgi:hypothetical protein